MSKQWRTLRTLYERTKAVCASAWSSDAAGASIRDMALASLRFLLSQCEPVDLISKVPGKSYIAYTRARGVVCRPANRGLFLPDADAVAAHWDAWLNGQIEAGDLARMSYTVALAPCLALELFDRQNKKGPATYFECLIGYIFAKALGVEPEKRVSLVVHGHKVRMTMDFLFHTREGVGIHLPVKMSTRERVVQAWAHQRILDASFGPGCYRGIRVSFSETKLDSRNHEVVEICVPEQWLAYQALLSRMHRVYYFDVPERYASLTEAHPDVISIRQFGQFFIEKDTLLSPDAA